MVEWVCCLVGTSWEGRWPAPKSGVDTLCHCGQGIPLLHDHSLGLLEAMIGPWLSFIAFVLFVSMCAFSSSCSPRFVEALKNKECNARAFFANTRVGVGTHISYGLH